MRGLLVLIVGLLVPALALCACGLSAEPDRGESAKPSPASSGPSTGSSPTAATSDTGDLVVCGQVAPLIAQINGTFNTLSAGATQRRRTLVAGAFERAHGKIRTIIERAGLPSGNAVRVQGLAVARETARVARLLRTGAAVGNADLQSAQRRLGVACRR